MAKPHVVVLSEQARVPFLRGILTRSLQDAKLSFDDAYDVASEIRQQLDDQPEISSDELRERVADLLEARFGAEVAERYRNPRKRAPATILVESSDGQLTPFSRGLHMRFLGASGLSRQQSALVTSRIHEHLLRMRVTQIPTSRLSYLTYLALRKSIGAKAARNFLVWSAFSDSERPLLILIGGTIGCGKSTIATALAHRLDIVRIQSTDMLREVMRIMMPERLLPVLHTSSFEAWRKLPFGEEGHEDVDRLIADGYQSQAELVTVACDAVLDRARKERLSLILEGVHIQPSFGESLRDVDDAVVVPIELAVLKQKELRRRIKGRGVKAPQRRATRYLNSFDAIWRLQSFLLSEADRCDVPIVANLDMDRAIEAIILLIMTRLRRIYAGEPREVFGLPPARRDQRRKKGSAPMGAVSAAGKKG